MAPLIALLVSFLFLRVLGLLGWAHMDDWHIITSGRSSCYVSAYRYRTLG